MEAPVERLSFGRWRTMLFSGIQRDRILEVGVGTGKNIRCYPPTAEVFAVDFSENMLTRATRVAGKLNRDVYFELADIEHLPFGDNTFEVVVGSFVFCSVPDPVQGLRELRRVCRPEGRVLLLEHVRPAGAFLGPLFDLLNPVAVRLSGANVNRRTADNIRAAGLGIKQETNLLHNVVKLFVAVPSGPGHA